MSQKVTGKIVYQEIGPGLWGIEEASGKEWRIVNMPEQLKYKGREVVVYLEEVDEMSIFMWGTSAEIIRFRTLQH